MFFSSLAIFKLLFLFVLNYTVSLTVSPTYGLIRPY